MKTPQLRGAFEGVKLSCRNAILPTSSPADKFLNRLVRVRQTAGNKWLASCPAHDDKSPSLSISETSDHTILVKCHAGCTAAEIVDAVGLELRDLFPYRAQNQPRRHDGLSAKKRRGLVKAAEHESYIIEFARAFWESGNDRTPEDAARVLLADNRIKKIRGVLKNG